MTAWTLSDRRWFAFVLTALLSVWNGCGDDEGSREPEPSGAGEGGAPEGEPSSGAAGSSDAGTRAEGGAGGVAEAASGGAEITGGSGNESAGAGGEPIVLPDPESVCPSGMTLADGSEIATATRYGMLAAVTPDELVAVWVTPSNGAMRVRTASRTAVSLAFGSPVVQEIDTPDPVSLSPDGLELTLVDADRRGFSLMRRASLDEPFERTQTGVFSLIAEAMENAPEDELLGDPVLAPDGGGFYYSRYGGGRRQTLLHSHRISPAAPWPDGYPVVIDEDSVADDLLLLRPIALSSDTKTLFLFDTQAEETITFRLLSDGTRYTRDAVLRDVGRVSTNDDCTRAYYTSTSELVSYVSDVTSEQ